MENALPRPLLIVKLGDTFEDLRDAHGDFEQWIAEGLATDALPVAVLDPRRGDLLPDADAIAGAVLTGSHAMVSHREPWSEATAAWLARTVERGTPVLGICYGHQLLAHALGGEAGDHPHGMEIGTVAVALEPAAAGDALMGELPARFDAHVVHRQSALRLPAGAVALARSTHEPVQAFRVGECAWGVQFHPEFGESAMRGYVDRLADDLRTAGADPQAVRGGVRATEASASLLARFAGIALAREVTRSESASRSAPTVLA